MNNWKKIGDIVNFKRGYDLPSYNRKEGIYPIISSSGISGYHNEYKASGEGLVTGRYGTLGEMYYVDGKYWPHNTALYTTDFKGNYPKYVYFLMKSLNSFQQSDKSTVPGINRNDLHEIKIPYIEKEYQKQVADVLFNIEKKIELNSRINRELEAMAKTVYDYWFVQFDFPNAEGKPYRTEGGEMVWSEALKREIPNSKDWKNGTLSDIGNIIGGSTPSKEIESYFTAKGTAWITPKDLSINNGNKFITKGEIDVSKEGLKAASLNIMPKGTVLLSSRAPIGYMAISREQVTTNQGFKSFVPKQGYSTPFVYYTVKNALPAIVNNGVGSTFKEVSAASMKSIVICLPPITLIQKYTEIVNPIFERQNKLELETQHLTALRDWLLPMLMNGQVRVE